jgi:putative ABC transport system permease protein
MAGLGKDLRLALRVLARNPGFSAVAILTLALTLGANTAIFSVFHTLVQGAVPWPEPDRLVSVRDVQPSFGTTSTSYPEFREWEAAGGEEVRVAAFFASTYNLTGRGEPRVVRAIRGSRSLAAVLRLSPLHGRWFSAAEEHSQGPPVAVVGHGFWVRQLGADPAAVGTALTLDDRVYTVVGVLPPGVSGVLRGDGTTDQPYDLWLPLRLDETRAPRGLHFMTTLARLGPGVSREQATDRLEAAVAARPAEIASDHGVEVRPLAEVVAGDLRTPLLTLQGAVAFVLLIACANLTSLFLARASARGRETAVRLALGASRPQLARQLLVESLTLTLTGGAVGIGLARLALYLLTGSGALRVLGESRFPMSLPVLAFTLGAAVVAGLLCGLAPALQTVGESRRGFLGGRGGTGGRERVRLRDALVTGQAALSLMLLLGAGLLLQSFVRLLSVEKGFAPAGVLAVEVALPELRYPEPVDQARFFEQALERLRSAPGITAVGLAHNVPLSGAGVSGDITIEEWGPEGEDAAHSEKRIVGPGYFRALGIPVLRGRDFSDQDRAGAPPVLLVSQSFADRYFPGEDPVGRRIGFEWGTDGLQEIVGVVGDVRHYGLEVVPEPTIYISYLQRTESNLSLLVRSPLEPGVLLDTVRAEVAAIDPDQAVAEARTLDELVTASLADRRLATLLAAGFAVAALVLSALGLYGVLSYMVRQRSREIGVRVALGAPAGQVAGLVLGRGLRLVLIGMTLGSLAALALQPVLAAQFLGIAPGDPLVFAAVATVLLAVALLSCALPARRALRVDPLVALKEE